MIITVSQVRLENQPTLGKIREELTLALLLVIYLQSLALTASSSLVSVRSLLHHCQCHREPGFVCQSSLQSIDTLLMFIRHLCLSYQLFASDHGHERSHSLHLDLRIDFALNLASEHQLSSPEVFWIFISFCPYFLHVSWVYFLSHIHYSFYYACWL